MASVRLDFTPLTGYTKLNIYEAPDEPSAPGVKIDTLTVDPDNPPTRYTTTLATGLTKWFSIQWEDAQGGLSEMSDPVQGGTTTLVQRLVDRVLLRDASLDERIVAQEAEWVISKVMGTNDPYDPALVDIATLDQISGMTYWIMARSYVSTIVTSTSSEDTYTVGLVTQKASSGTATKKVDTIKDLLDLAMRELGMGGAYVMLLEDIDPTGTFNISGIDVDISRLQVTSEIL